MSIVTSRAVSVDLRFSQRPPLVRNGGMSPKKTPPHFHSALLLLCAAFVYLPPASSLNATPPAPAHSLLETRTVTPPEEPYAGWPTLARRRNGELWLVWSGGRDGHVCPMGQVRAMHSRDDGKTWTYPRVLLDSVLDDRDSGVLETDKGTLLVTTFTSLAYESSLKKATAMAEHTPEGWKSAAMSTEQLARWQASHQRLADDSIRNAQLGEWLIRSTDNGLTWSPPIRSVLNSPHGPSQLKDGRLLYAGKELWSETGRIGVAESKDDGLTWKWVGEIAVRPGDVVKRGYHELHQVETDDGRILVHIRNHNTANAGETLQCESTDGGRTWTVPAPIGVWGLPSHLLKLRDGRLLMTYGYRRAPFGNQARISADHGRTWSDPISLSTDGMGGDLGYPSSVELADNTLLTVWYEKMKEPARAVLRQTRWKLEPGHP
jgi:sialidase-1